MPTPFLSFQIFVFSISEILPEWTTPNTEQEST